MAPQTPVQQPAIQPLYPQPQVATPYGQPIPPQAYGPVPGQQPFGSIPFPQASYGQPQYPGQFGVNPQVPAYNQFGQLAPQPHPAYGYGQGVNYGAGMPAPVYQQPPQPNPYINQMYPTTAPLAGNQAQKGNLNLSTGITLSPKKED